MVSLAASFGRGAMTNHWIDLKNSDVIMVMGANPGENHPVGFRWALKAREKKNAKIVVIDPRLTRTAAVADIFVPLRSGTDIAFLGFLINYCITNNLYFKEYVVNYTNAPFLVKNNFGFKDGLFSGYLENEHKYDTASWGFQLDSSGNVMKDLSLENPHSVFQIVKKHYSRYTPETVSKITGVSSGKLIEAARVICSTGNPDRVGTVMYAVGWTQHTVGSQNIRAASMLQLLLGNIGRPGGGVNALRGHANVQGQTDHGLVATTLPGYLKMPVKTQTTLGTYLKENTPSKIDKHAVNYWSNTPKFLVSLLKAWWGNSATKENDFNYEYLPRLDSNTTWMFAFNAMFYGKINGLIDFGMNPACVGPNSDKMLASLGRLKWLAVIDPFAHETACFWKRPGADPEEINTEVFMLPSSDWIEEDGSFTNSGRWVQWKYKAYDPAYNIKSDTWIISNIFLKIRKLYEKSGGAFPGPITDLSWNYEDIYSPTKEEIAKEINGKDLKTGKLLPSFVVLKDDGTTASGNWIYSGSFTEAGNMMKRKKLTDNTKMGMFHEWSWSWPVNRRILYNRASADLKGNPWNEKLRALWWNGKEWVGDVPDYPPTAPPSKEIGPFIMTNSGYANIFSNALVDGPIAEHYEPIESPTVNILHPNVAINPAVQFFKDKLDIIGKPSKYPYVCTTYRVAEHEHYLTRWVPYLVEIMPDFFVELPYELAEEKGIQNGGKVKVSSARGEVVGIAVVTKRIEPLIVNGKKVWQIGVPLHWGYEGLVKGPLANLLTLTVGDPNAFTPEYKTFLVNISIP